MILIPHSFKDITFGEAGGWIVEEMDISAGVADLKIRLVAGGSLFDFNYGQRAMIIPAPFTVKLFLRETATADLQDLYEELASPSPLNGIVGWVDTFTAKDRNNTSWTCTAGCQTIQKILTADDNIDDTNILEGIAIPFIPVTNWLEA